MADEQQRTRLAAAILGEGDRDKRKATLEARNPVAQQFLASWELLADAYEGDGGFLDGSHLWRFPAEIAEDYQERQSHARYHNFQETLVDIYVRHVAGQGVTRSTSSNDLEAWWKDVDGAGTSMHEFVKLAAAHALNQGHVGALIDKTPDPPTGPSKADERARVIATLYQAESILDWRLDRQELTAVKLAEAAPEPAITEAPDPDRADQQTLLWDREEWARFSADGDLTGENRHDLGLVPLAILRPKPSKRYPLIGRPLTRADVIRALYNRSSEEDHVMRAQGFSLLTVNVPADASPEAVEQTQAQVAANYGTKRALVVRGSVSYVSPDMEIPATIRANIQFLIQELYRAAHIAYQRDSMDAESAEAIRLKHTELNEMLRALAQALTAFELRIARLWFAWQSPTPEQAQQAFDAASVSVQYPTEFFTQALVDDIKAWAEAVRFGLPGLFVKRMQKRVVRRIEPDIPQDVAAEVDKAIDAMPEQSPNAQPGGQGGNPDELRARAARRLARFAGAGAAGGDGQQPPDGDQA